MICGTLFLFFSFLNKMKTTILEYLKRIDKKKTKLKGEVHSPLVRGYCVD